MSNGILSSVIIPVAASIIGVIVGAAITFISIRLSARESRVSTVHERMSSCLVQTLDIIWETMHLLADVANRVSYRTLDTEEFKETAYDRYWRNLDRLMEDNRH